MLTLTVMGLGFFAGVTIFLGMPLARLKATSPNARTFVGMVAAGILVFLFWDVLDSALGPVAVAADSGNLGFAYLSVALVLGAFAFSYLGLTWFEQIYRGRGSAGSGTNPTAAISAFGPLRAMNLIAVGIGLHNFAEGLAIGTTYSAGVLATATLLFVGFAVHNSTEGFGIVGPAMAAGIVPSWRRLLALGAVGGVPTLLGTITGSVVAAPYVSTAFLAIAAGAILYVVVQLVRLGDPARMAPLRAAGIFLGFAIGLLTDIILTASHL
jgi:zinc transporter, ZIP family